MSTVGAETAQDIEVSISAPSRSFHATVVATDVSWQDRSPEMARKKPVWSSAFGGSTDISDSESWDPVITPSQSMQGSIEVEFISTSPSNVGAPIVTTISASPVYDDISLINGTLISDSSIPHPIGLSTSDSATTIIPMHSNEEKISFEMRPVVPYSATDKGSISVDFMSSSPVVVSNGQLPSGVQKTEEELRRLVDEGKTFPITVVEEKKDEVKVASSESTTTPSVERKESIGSTEEGGETTSAVPVAPESTFQLQTHDEEDHSVPPELPRDRAMSLHERSLLDHSEVQKESSLETIKEPQEGEEIHITTSADHEEQRRESIISDGPIDRRDSLIGTPVPTTTFIPSTPGAVFESEKEEEVKQIESGPSSSTRAPTSEPSVYARRLNEAQEQTRRLMELLGESDQQLTTVKNGNTPPNEVEEKKSGEPSSPSLTITSRPAEVTIENTSFLSSRPEGMPGLVKDVSVQRDEKEGAPSPQLSLSTEASAEVPVEVLPETTTQRDDSRSESAPPLRKDSVHLTSTAPVTLDSTLQLTPHEEEESQPPETPRDRAMSIHERSMAMTQEHVGPQLETIMEPGEEKHLVSSEEQKEERRDSLLEALGRKDSLIGEEGQSTTSFIASTDTTTFHAEESGEGTSEKKEEHSQNESIVEALNHIASAVTQEPQPITEEQRRESVHLTSTAPLTPESTFQMTPHEEEEAESPETPRDRAMSIHEKTLAMIQEHIPQLETILEPGEEKHLVSSEEQKEQQRRDSLIDKPERRDSLIDFPQQSTTSFVASTDTTTFHAEESAEGPSSPADAAKVEEKENVDIPVEVMVSSYMEHRPYDQSTTTGDTQSTVAEEIMKYQEIKPAEETQPSETQKEEKKDVDTPAEVMPSSPSSEQKPYGEPQFTGEVPMKVAEEVTKYQEMKPVDVLAPSSEKLPDSPKVTGDAQAPMIVAQEIMKYQELKPADVLAAPPSSEQKSYDEPKITGDAEIPMTVAQEIMKYQELKPVEEIKPSETPKEEKKDVDIPVEVVASPPSSEEKLSEEQKPTGDAQVPMKVAEEIMKYQELKPVEETTSTETPKEDDLGTAVTVIFLKDEEKPAEWKSSEESKSVEDEEGTAIPVKFIKEEEKSDEERRMIAINVEGETPIASSTTEEETPKTMEDRRESVHLTSIAPVNLGAASLQLTPTEEEEVAQSPETPRDRAMSIHEKSLLAHDTSTFGPSLEPIKEPAEGEEVHITSSDQHEPPERRDSLISAIGQEGGEGQSTTSFIVTQQPTVFNAEEAGPATIIGTEEKSKEVEPSSPALTIISKPIEVSFDATQSPATPVSTERPSELTATLPVVEPPKEQESPKTQSVFDISAPPPASPNAIDITAPTFLPSPKSPTKGNQGVQWLTDSVISPSHSPTPQDHKAEITVTSNLPPEAPKTPTDIKWFTEPTPQSPGSAGAEVPSSAIPPTSPEGWITEQLQQQPPQVAQETTVVPQTVTEGQDMTAPPQTPKTPTGVNWITETAPSDTSSTPGGISWITEPGPAPSSIGETTQSKGGESEFMVNAPWDGPDGRRQEDSSKTTTASVPDADGISWITEDAPKTNEEGQRPPLERTESTRSEKESTATDVTVREPTPKASVGPSVSCDEDLTNGVTEEEKGTKTRRLSWADKKEKGQQNGEEEFNIDEYERRLNETTAQTRDLVNLLCSTSQQLTDNTIKMSEAFSSGAQADVRSLMDQERKERERKPLAPIQENAELQTSDISPEAPPQLASGALPANVESVILSNPELKRVTGSIVLTSGNILVTDEESGLFLFTMDSQVVKHVKNDNWKGACSPTQFKDRLKNYILVLMNVKDDDGQWVRSIMKINENLEYIEKVECPKWLRERTIVSERLSISKHEEIYYCVNGEIFSALYELNTSCKWTEILYKQSESFIDMLAFACIGPITQVLIVEGRRDHVMCVSVRNSECAEVRRMALCERPGALAKDESGRLFVLNRSQAAIQLVDTRVWASCRNVSLVDKFVPHFGAAYGLLCIPQKNQVKVHKYSFEWDDAWWL